MGFFVTAPLETARALVGARPISTQCDIGWNQASGAGVITNPGLVKISETIRLYNISKLVSVMKEGLRFDSNYWCYGNIQWVK